MFQDLNGHLGPGTGLGYPDAAQDHLGESVAVLDTCAKNGKISEFK